MPLDAASFNNLVDIYEGEIDSLINNMGKTVRIYFPATVTGVNEGFYDPVRGGDARRPDYSTTAQNPNPTRTHDTRDILALLSVDPAEFETFGINVKNPRGILRLKTYLSDVPDLVRAEFVVPNPSLTAIVNHKYKLVRPPTPRGLKRNRYALSYWEIV
jgi:hypothetical protein